MKAQVTSILLCALLCSTLGHEYLAAKRLAPEAKSNYRSPLAHFQDRAAGTSEHCEWVCGNSTSETGGLQIIVNETTNLVGVVNVTAKVAIVIDINANLVGLFNGSTGSIIVINIQTGVGVYITGSQTTKGWISSKLSFDVYFRTLISLQVFIDLKVGTTFNVSSASNAILEIIGNLLAKLSTSIDIEIQENIAVSITILIKITSSIIASLKGSLSGLLKIFGSGLISLGGDILWLVSVFEGLSLVFSKISGGLAALIKAKVELDIALLLGASNGLQLFINLLLAVVVQTDLVILAGVLNSVEVLIEVIVKLGGNVSTGVTGIWKIIYEIIAVQNNKIKIEVLVETLLEFSVEQLTSIEISGYIQGLVEVIRLQTSRYSSTSVQVFITFVQNLQQGKLVIAGIDISGIISILIKGAVGGVLVLVLTVLFKLTAIIKSADAILLVLLTLLRRLSTRAGRLLLTRIIPGIAISVSVGVNIFIEIFKSVNLVTIATLILTGFDLTVVLTSVPVLGQIYKAVSSAVSAASNGSFSLSIVIKSSGSSSFVASIKAWFQEGLNIAKSGGGGGGITVSVGGGGSSTGSGGGGASVTASGGGGGSATGSAGGGGGVSYVVTSKPVSYVVTSKPVTSKIYWTLGFGK